MFSRNQNGIQYEISTKIFTPQADDAVGHRLASCHIEPNQEYYINLIPSTHRSILKGPGNWYRNSLPVYLFRLGTRGPYGNDSLVMKEEFRLSCEQSLGLSANCNRKVNFAIDEFMTVCDQALGKQPRTQLEFNTRNACMREHLNPYDWERSLY